MTMTATQKDILLRMPSLRPQFLSQNGKAALDRAITKYGEESFEAQEARWKYQRACDRADGRG